MFDNNVMQIKTLGRYRVELHTGTEQGEERSDCTITTKFNGGEYGGSLALLESHEGLYNDREDFIAVPNNTITAIYQWAENHGY